MRSVARLSIPQTGTENCKGFSLTSMIRTTVSLGGQPGRWHASSFAETAVVSSSSRSSRAQLLILRAASMTPGFLESERVYECIAQVDFLLFFRDRATRAENCSRMGSLRGQ